MKKIFLVLFTMLLFASVCFALIPDDSLINPIVITNCSGLQNMKNNLSGNYILSGNINCYTDTRSGGVLWNGGKGFIPIGNASTPFRGKFDGKGFTIDGIFETSDETDSGLFGYLKNATVKNVGLTNLYIFGFTNAGGLAGTSDASNVSDVYTTGRVSGSGKVGGVIGQQTSSAQLIHVYSKPILNTGQSGGSGGLVGFNANGCFIEKSFAVISYTYITVPGKLVSGWVFGIAGINQGTILDAYWFNLGASETHCYYNLDAGCTKADSLSRFYSSQYAVYNIPPAWGNNWSWSGTALPTLNQNYVCYGSFDLNSEPFTGDDVNLSEADEKLIELKETNTSRKCEYRCKEGFYKSGNKCIQYSCKNDSGINLTNSSLCLNDDFPLAFDLNKSLVNFNSCTSQKKCEWQCLENYFVSADKKSCLPFECTAVPQNTILCTNDNNGLTRNTESTLIESFSKCTAEKKCEYYCKSNFYAKENTCAQWGCGNEVDGNNMVLYPNDHLNIINKSELVSVLVEKDTNRKCEWHCEDGFFKNKNKCDPYLCKGDADTNSIKCSGDDFNLDKDYPITLVTSSSACTDDLKCQWYCRNGFYEKEGKCLALSTLTCEGAPIPNAEICPDDDVFLPQKGITNILLYSKENCSESRKCQWYCSKGYYMGNGADANKCVPFVCDGNVFENSMLYYKDDLALEKNTLRNLVDENTSAKCEYYCKAGFHVEINNGVKKCVHNIYSCVGEFENATLFDLDESELTSDILSVLSKNNTARKCEWKCNEGFVKIGESCASTDKNEASCGTAVRKYLIGEKFPGDYTLCNYSTPSKTSIVLDNEMGATVSWKCMGDTNILCKAMRVSSYEGQRDFNSILELITDSVDDTNILVSIKCSNPMKVNLSVKGLDTDKNYPLDQNQIDCNSDMTTHLVSLLSVPVDESGLIVKTKVAGLAKSCHTCEMTSSLSINLTYGELKLDPILILAIVLVVIIVAVFINLISGSSEDEEEQQTE
jgi:hypothetical protein